MKSEMITTKHETEAVKVEAGTIHPETGMICPMTEAANSELAVTDTRYIPTTVYRKNPAAQYVSKEATYATTVV